MIPRPNFIERHFAESRRDCTLVDQLQRSSHLDLGFYLSSGSLYRDCKNNLSIVYLMVLLLR